MIDTPTPIGIGFGVVAEPVHVAQLDGPRMTTLIAEWTGRETAGP
jgi:hypothetical protein